MATTLYPRVDAGQRAGKWWRGNGQTLWGCPKCGQAHVLSPHIIRADGEVTPSVVCAKCDFHDHVTLDEVAPECVNG